MLDLSKSLEFFNPSSVDGRIHILGCGSVGATIAESLVRLGLTKLTLWDFDTVCSHNLANQIFRQKDVGKLKTEALLDILLEINPDAKRDIRLRSDGWHGEALSGIVFLAVDSIELRQEIVKQHYYSMSVKAMFDTRTLLTGAQHFAADWSNEGQKKNLLKSMDFTDADAEASTPVSACGVTLGVAPTVKGICALEVANFVNWCKGQPLHKFIAIDVFDFCLESYG